MTQEEVVEKLSKEDWIRKIKIEGIQTEFGVNDWGSCQYTGALQFFETFFRIREDLSLEDTLEVLGCRFDYQKITSLAEVKRQMIRNCVERIYEDLEDDFYGVKYESQKMAMISEAGDVDSLFTALRKSAVDLWTAAPYISSLFFEGLECEAPDAPGKGPVGNLMVQQGNFITGLHCAMLCETNLITDSTSAFANFDT